MKIVVLILVFSLISFSVFGKEIADSVPELQKQVKNARWIAKVFGILATIMFAGLVVQESVDRR